MNPATTGSIENAAAKASSGDISRSFALLVAPVGVCLGKCSFFFLLRGGAAGDTDRALEQGLETGVVASAKAFASEYRFTFWTQKKTNIIEQLGFYKIKSTQN